MSASAARCAAFWGGEANVEDIANKVFEPDSSHAPIVNQQPGAGTQLFVINLCASIAPVSTTGRNIPGLENYRLYQVARVEDGRTRHRLRLGFFTNEAHAERVLTVVRQQYPTAFTASLSEEDRRFTRGFLPESAPAAAPKRPQVAAVPTPPAPAIAASKPAAAKAPAPTPTPPEAKAPAAASKPQSPAKKGVEDVVELTWEPDAAAKAAAASMTQPKMKALKIPGLDDMSWNDPPPAAANARVTPSEPLAVGLLSGKFAALDTSKLKAASPSKPTTSTAKPATPPAPVAVPPKLDSASSVRVPALTFSDPEPMAAAKASQSPAQPYHVGKGLDLDAIDDFQLDLGDEPPAKAAAPAQKPTAPAVRKPTPPTANIAPTVVAKKAEPMARPTTAAANAVPAAKPAVPVLNQEASQAHPNLDSTQTIRALTSEELNDNTQEKWFAIQLAASEQPVNLDTMPHLDIFEAYSLYSVATAGSGKIVHSLRLGFFKEAVSAEAVSGYLKTFFAAPSVLRISVAEQARFKDAPQPRRPATGEPKNNVVPLNNARSGRAPIVPTITMEVENPRIDPMATGAFRAQATGSLNSATGTFKPGATGAFKAGATGAFKLDSTGSNRALSEGRVAARTAAPATKRSEPTRGNTGKHQTLKKSLAQELLEEARETELSESGIRKLPQNSSLLSRLLGKKK